MNGKPRQIYMNTNTEEKAKKVCERYGISMSALIRMALEDYISKAEREAAAWQTKDITG